LEVHFAPITRVENLVKKYLIAISVLFALSPQCFAQSEVSLKLGGVTVWLGMSKQEAVKRFSESSYKVIEAKDLMSAVVDQASNAVGLVTFTSGHLSYAQRSWGTCEENCLDSVLAALASIAADGIKRCTLERDTILEPATKTDRVSIICGQRGVLMLKGKIGGKGVAGVEEFIRSEP
jgi:hypothetical protein